MKCINKDKFNNILSGKRKEQIVTFCVAIVLAAIAIACVCVIQQEMKFFEKDPDIAYEKEHYNNNLYEGSLFAKTLCVTSEDVSSGKYQSNAQLSAVGLFDINNATVMESANLFGKIYPASTTKLLTADLVLKYANLDDIVTISESINDMDPEAQRCGLVPGDQVSMYDLLCGLILQSGNDAGIAIAEYMSGSMEEFVEWMNKEANCLGATGTHFVNDHGLHDEDHYTTAYDLYLIFNDCCKDQRFLDIIGMKSYVGTIIGADGTSRTEEWLPTNYYSAGLKEQPENATVIGGKTGTTDEAGACVVLYSKDSEGNPYISIIMGADDKQILYDEMTSLLVSDIN